VRPDGPVTLEILVEERSAETALRVLLPRIVPGTTFRIYTFQGKRDLLSKLPYRLRDYARYATAAGIRVVVLLDRDDDDCRALKERLERMAADAGIRTPSATGGPAELVFRIVVEELESWFLGDVPALRCAYPRLPPDLDQQVKYRDPENIVGGAWEALAHVLSKHGYHRTGLAKIAAASDIARHMNVESNRCRSFHVFRDGLRRLVNGESDA
jgi:hypothetical protein